MLSEKPDTKDDILSDSIYMKFPEKAKQRESRSMVTWDWEETGFDCKWNDGSVLKLDCGEACTTV